jgi:hypothetical protein
VTFPNLIRGLIPMATTRKTDAQIAASAAVTSGLITAEEVEASRQEIEVSTRFSQEALANLETWDDALRLATTEFGGVILAHEDKDLGTGFRLTDDDEKYRLIGVPILLLDWRFNPGDFGDDFVSIQAMTQDEAGKASKLIINDGGSGICRDLKTYTKKTGRMGGLICRRGLRVSEYDTIADKDHPDNGKPAPRDYVGKTGKGKTFYLDFGA